jgi:hypothetical protein
MNWGLTSFNNYVKKTEHAMTAPFATSKVVVEERDGSFDRF